MKTALLYSFNTTRTKAVAEQISEMIKGQVAMLNIEEVGEEAFAGYENLICGVPTWFDGELPMYWDEWIPAIQEMNLSGKKVAIFGLADQIRYPENFADAVGILAKIFESCGAEIIGKTENLGYRFNQSKALENGLFFGLILDEDNQPGLTKSRITDWVEKIKKETSL